MIDPLRLSSVLRPEEKEVKTLKVNCPHASAS
jgi:hypothetical protein